MRRVAAEGKHILDAVGLDSVESMVDLLDRHVGTGEMHHGLDADGVLHLVGDLEGEIGGGATSSPCDVAEGGGVRHHPIHPVEEIIDSILGLGREEFEGEDDLSFLGARITDLLNHLHLLLSAVRYCCFLSLLQGDRGTDNRR